MWRPTPRWPQSPSVHVLLRLAGSALLFGILHRWAPAQYVDAGAGGSPGQGQRYGRHRQRSLVHPSSSIASAIGRAFADRASGVDIGGNWVVLVDHDAQRVHMARYLSVVDLDLMRVTVSSL